MNQNFGKSPNDLFLIHFYSFLIHKIDSLVAHFVFKFKSFTASRRIHELLVTNSCHVHVNS